MQMRWMKTTEGIKNADTSSYIKPHGNAQTFSTCGREWVNRVSHCSPPHITSVIQGPTKLVLWTLINLQRADLPTPSLSLSLSILSQTVYYLLHSHFRVCCTFVHYLVTLSVKFLVRHWGKKTCLLIHVGNRSRDSLGKTVWDKGKPPQAQVTQSDISSTLLWTWMRIKEG